MRHDYDHPPDWDALSPEEKSRWMLRERCRRQAKRQATPAVDAVISRNDRIRRRLAAQDETEAVTR
jgi:type II secretory pathway component PulJ